MDFRSKSFLAVIIILFATAVFGFAEGLIPLGIIFAVFGAAGVAVWVKAKKK